MDIKKIVKRNLKNLAKDVLHIPVKLISIPWGYGFAHASYLYFYITNPNGTDDELDKFLNDQAEGLRCAIRHMEEECGYKVEEVR